MHVDTVNEHHKRIVFDSVADISAWCLANDHRGARMADNPSFHDGVSSMKQAADMAAKGLPADGVTALKLADAKTRETHVKSTQFQTFYDVAGSDVDVARFLSGEPENMMNYYLEDITKSERVVTLVAALGVPGGTRVEQLRRKGEMIVALAEAIDSSGKQTEIWAEFTTGNPGRMTARAMVLLKSAGQQFDAGALMYAMSHASFYRGMLFNAMHALPADWRKRLGIYHGGGYGHCVDGFHEPGDYPDGTIYLPIASGYGERLEQDFQKILRDLGLTD